MEKVVSMHSKKGVKCSLLKNTSACNQFHMEWMRITQEIAKPHSDLGLRRFSSTARLQRHTSHL